MTLIFRTTSEILRRTLQQGRSFCDITKYVDQHLKCSENLLLLI